MFRRQLHTTRWLRNDAASISNMIEKYTKQESPLQSSDTLKALQACSKLEYEYCKSSQPDSPIAETSPEKARSLLSQLLESPNVKLDNKILHDYFVTEPSPSSESCVHVIKRFQRQNNRAIPKEISMIPFRRAVYNADFLNAFNLMDVAVNSTQYKQMIRNTWKKYAGYWALGTGSIMTGIELLLQSGMVGTWESTTMVHLMVLTYLSSITVYSGLAFGGRVSGNGDVLKWTQGTITTHWFSHASEMKMSSLIADMNRSLPENQGECSHKLRQDMKHRQMATVELEDESLLKEYWAKGGDGFEWVEPDQDPAEIIWNEKMDKSRSKRIGSSYSAQPNENYEWADQVVRQSLPHASLVEKPHPKLLDS